MSLLNYISGFATGFSPIAYYYLKDNLVICFKKFIFANIIFSGIIAYYYSNLLVNTELQRTLKLIIKGLSLCLISIGVSDNKTYVVLTLCIFRIEILSRLRNNFFGQISNNSLIKRHKNSLKKKLAC